RARWRRSRHERLSCAEPHNSFAPVSACRRSGSAIAASCSGPPDEFMDDPHESPGRKFLRLYISIGLPVFLAFVDQTILACALPAIASDFGASGRVAWTVVAYLPAAAIATPVYGQLGDAFGRRRLLAVALVVATVGSLLCAVSINMDMLIGARTLQGLGAGGLMSLSQALISQTVAPRERARYQGYLATTAVVASSLGPVAGGLLTSTF